jgi:hypothetical protein
MNVDGWLSQGDAINGKSFYTAREQRSSIYWLT